MSSCGPTPAAGPAGRRCTRAWTTTRSRRSTSTTASAPPRIAAEPCLSGLSPTLDRMSSPAQRYAAFRKQQAEDGPELTRFQALYDFSFDEFQLRACRALVEGHGVLVAAPTGSGKTVVGEFAVHLALAEGRKCFDPSPTKALSTQKYGALVRRYGTGSVGLLTGDNSINGEAPVVVMTTEVLRNMLYGGSATLAGLSHVVLDEVHYLADPSRGAGWGEGIINLPDTD